MRLSPNSCAEPILLDPEDISGVADYCGRFFATEQNMISTILEVTRRAQKANVEVRWSPYMFQGMVINDPEDEGASSAYVRVELLYPGIESEFRSNFIVKRSNNKELFQTLVKAYKRTWDDARPAVLPKPPGLAR
jgi:hypothetical protein